MTVEWISVKAETPENGVRALFCDQFGARYVGMASHGFCFGATHWMPLPEPPPAEKEEPPK